ncbi:MAG: hypothetical protein R3C18_03220 [Planctomycetaceae bacterium]
MSWRYAAVVALLLMVPASAARADDEKPTIKSIMKVAFKDGLAQKVATGEASAEETQNFLKVCQALKGLKPPKGDAESWDMLTKSLVDAAQAAVDGKEDAPALLRKATNCKSCHGPHKP